MNPIIQEVTDRIIERSNDTLEQSNKSQEVPLSKGGKRSSRRKSKKSKKSKKPKKKSLKRRRTSKK